MVRYELFYLLLVSLVFRATSLETANTLESNINNKGEPPDKLILQKSQPYAKREVQQSFISNLVSWIFPSNTSPEERGDFTGGYRYLPAPTSQSHIEKDCNPCNLEPWIPIASSVGEKTVINFVPPVKNFGQVSGDYSDLSVLETLHPPPLSYKAPIAHYASPPQFRPKDNRNNFGLPKRPPQLQNNGDIVVVDYMVPPPINYRIPSLIYGPPKPVYNAPPRPIYGAPPPKPKPLYSPGPAQFGNNNQYLGQPFITPPETTYLSPIPQDFGPPPPPISDLSNVNHQTFSFDEAATDQNAPIAPSDSYGAPVTGDSLNYFSPPEQLSLANEHSEYVERPIPLPNLSSFPILPIRKYGDFNKNFIHGPESDRTEVKIQESVKIADYLASIDHPINVIQSPLIELSIKDENYDENDKSYGNLNTGGLLPSRDNDNHQTNSLNQEPYPIKENIYRDEKAQKPYSNINEQLQSVDKSAKLSENPIIVEDVHAAASSNNDTFVNSNEIHIKRSNGKELGTPNANINGDSTASFKNSLEPLSGTSIIKSLLLDQKVISETAKPFTRSDHVAINNNFTVPPLDYGNWTPSFGVTMSNLKTSSNSIKPTTTKKPKLLQIIVPYVTSKQTGSVDRDWRNKNGKPLSAIPNYTGAYSTLLPVFIPPETTQVSVWSKYSTIDLKPATQTPAPVPKVTTGVYNIKELLSKRTERLPYDIISLQKHIDNWTQQAYSLSMQKEKSSPPKEIPSEYFTTQDPNSNLEVTTLRNQLGYNNLDNPAQRQAEKADDGDIDSNLIIPTETTTEKFTTTMKTTLSPKENHNSSWNVSHVTVSPQSKEKVYIVTPQTYSFYTSTPATAWSSAPRVENGKVNNGSTYDSYKFSIRVEPQNKTSREKLKREGKGAVKIVYSEWPHLINGLQTTTKKPSSRHPLFGLMDIEAFSLPLNSTAENIFGHSRVASTATSPSVPETQTKVTTSKGDTLT